MAALRNHWHPIDFMAMGIPLPEEMAAAADFMLSTHLSPQVDFCEETLPRAKLVVEQASGLQRKWYTEAGPRIQTAKGAFTPITMSSMCQFNMGETGCANLYWDPR